MSLVLMQRNEQHTLGIIALAAQIIDRCDVKTSTKQTYKYGVEKFLQYCDQCGIDRDILRRYKQHLGEITEKSANTKALYLNAAKTCTRYFFEMQWLSEDVTGSVKSFKIATEHKRSPISEIDRKKVFNFLERLGDARLSLIFHLLAFQGLRRQEVCSLRVEDFNASNKTLLIQAKGYDGKTLVNLHSRTVRALQRYLGTTHLASGCVFPSRSARGHISTVQLHRLVQDVHRRCYMKANVHAWRKYFTSTLLENGFDVITASKFTRHKSVQTLSVYYDRVDVGRRLGDFERVFAC